MASFPDLFSVPLNTTVSFDLHGYRRQEALEAVKGFFAKAKEEQYTSMTIITGRGNHANSNGTRGVLYNSMPRWLERPEIKAAIKEIRMDMGAYEIILKSEQDAKKQATLDKVVNVVDPLLFPPDQVEEIRRKAAQGSISHKYLLGGLMLTGRVVEKDLKGGAELVQQAAEGGDSFAQMQMGFICALGWGVPPSYPNARKWHKRAAEDGKQPHSLFVLGEYYWVGKGVKKDDKKAIGYLKRAAELNEPVAAYNLGKILLDGSDKTKPDGPQACRYLEQGAQLGVLESKVLLAKQYFFGLGDIPCDLEKARKWFLEAAKEGDATAEYYLGRIYFEGLGVSADVAAAIGWYRRSAEHGDRDAQHFLAIARIEGKVLPQEIARGWKEVNELAAEGHVQSLASQGCYQIDGLGKEIPKNTQEALRCLRQAAEKGYLEAQKILSKLCLSRDRDFANEKEGEKWLNKAVESGDPESLYRRAIFLESKRGNAQEIVACYQRSADQGYVKACFMLGLLKLDGEMVKKDVAGGMVLLRSAAKGGESEAHFELGKRLMQSKNEQEQKEGASHFAAIAATNRHAQVGLAYCYLHGRGVPQNRQKAEEWFEKAAKNGEPVANQVMGSFCMKKGLLKEAFDYFLVAANEGIEGAILPAARFYIEGKTVPENRVEARRLLKPLVDQNHPEALFLMGLSSDDPLPWLSRSLERGHWETAEMLKVLYSEGSTEALSLLTKCAESGNETALLAMVTLSNEEPAQRKSAPWMAKAEQSQNPIILFSVAINCLSQAQRDQARAKKLLLRVLELSKDSDLLARTCETLIKLTSDREQQQYLKRALELYHKTEKNAESQYRMGCLLLEFGGDPKEARLWLTRASQQQHDDATYRLGILLLALSEQDSSLTKEAFTCLLHCAEKGYVDAMFQVAYSFQTGEGVIPSLEEACRWYREAAGHGHQGAQTNLDQILQQQKEAETEGGCAIS